MLIIKCVKYFIFINIFLNSISAKNIVHSKAQDTAALCLFFDNLFDSMNGNFHKVKDGKIFRTCVKKNSPHHQLWRDSIKILETMYFIDPVTKEKKNQPPTIKNWIKTVRGKLLN